MTPLRIVIASVLAVSNLAYWWWVVSSEDRCRQLVEGAYGVRITRGPRGHWVVEGDRPWWARLGLELLQLGYFMGAFVLWAIALVVGLLLLKSVDGEGRGP